MVKQAAHVLELLEFFALHKRPATLAEISSHFGWPRSSTFNLLNTLADRGYLFEPRPKAGYYPSPRWFNLAEQIRLAEPIPEHAHELLVELAKCSGETVVLVAASGPHGVFVDVVESKHAVRYTAPIGKVVPLVATATGRALLSQRSPAERDALLRKAVFVQYTPTTLMSMDAIERDIVRSSKRGWFGSQAEYSLGLAGLAVPLPMPPRQYALLIAGPMDRMGARYEELFVMARKLVAEYLGVDISPTA